MRHFETLHQQFLLAETAKTPVRHDNYTWKNPRYKDSILKFLHAPQKYTVIKRVRLTKHKLTLLSPLHMIKISSPFSFDKEPGRRREGGRMKKMKAINKHKNQKVTFLRIYFYGSISPPSPSHSQTKTFITGVDISIISQLRLPNPGSVQHSEP